MANILLAWQNRVDEAIMSEGSWLTSLPLTNVQNRQVQKVARTTNANESSTRMVAAFRSGGSYFERNIDTVALVVHNMSVSARARVMTGPHQNAVINALANPNDFTAASWTKTNATITLNDAVSPTGHTTAQRLAATAGGSPATVTQTYTQGSSNTPLAIFVYSKKGSAPTAMTEFRVRRVSPLQTLTQGTVNTDTQQVTLTVGSGNDVSVADEGNGWVRLRVNSTIPTSAQVEVTLGSISTTPAAGDYAYVWTPFATRDGRPTYVSKYEQVWLSGQTPIEMLEWEEDNFWLGTLSRDARRGYQSPWVHVMPQPVITSAIGVDIADSSNSDGYIQIGRMFAARSWTPSVNYAYGAGMQYEDPTVIERSLSGAEYFDVRSRYRVFEAQLQFITNNEAYGYVLELQRLAGTSGEVLVIQNPEDQQYVASRAFVGRLLELRPIRQEQPSAQSVELKIKELL